VAKSGKNNAGQPFNRSEIAKRFKTACRALGEERVASLSIHDGRHTAATQLLERGKSLATVRDFLRHSNISTTSAYLHGAELKPEEMYQPEGD
jgi:site-specific recombinase XerD